MDLINATYNKTYGAFALATAPCDLEDAVYRILHENGLDPTSIIEVDSDMTGFEYYPRLLCGVFIPIGEYYKLVIKSKSVNETKDLMVVPKVPEF